MCLILGNDGGEKESLRSLYMSSYHFDTYTQTCANIIPLQLGGEAGVHNPRAEKMKTLFRGLSVVLVLVTATFPAVW